MEDMDSYVKLLQPYLLYYNQFFHKTHSPYQLKQEFEKSGLWEENSGVMAITDEDNKIIGSIWFYKTNLFEAYEISYLIFNEEDRGKGVMSEALKLFSAFMFAAKNINRLQVSIPDYHRASIAVVQKCGYTFEGIARQAVFSNGKYNDLCLYSLLREECKNLDNLLA